MEFHQYRETIVKGGLATGAATENLLSAFDRSVKFDFAFAPHEEISIDESLVALPFDTILVRLRLEGAHLFLWCNKAEGFIGVQGLCVFPDGHTNMCAFKIHEDLRVENIAKPLNWPAYLQFEDDFSVVENRAQALGAFLTLLNQPDQKTEEYRPSDKLNRKRVANGKPPLIAYKVLTIRKPRMVPPPCGSHGGTHASPRLHLRRGHFRFVRGRYVWVRPAIVGDKKRGLLLKDYEVRPGEQRTH